jgi:putative ABC transport system substrate-binding protein
VTVIVAITTPPALAARAATATVPIVFSVPDDPVKLGLVTSLARPGGNATGVNFMLSELGAKQLGLLYELVPKTARFGLLVNPHNTNAEAVRDVMAAASAIGVGVDVREASDSRGIEAAFAVFVQNRIDALVVGTDPFFFRRRLPTRHAGNAPCDPRRL